ncbi:type IV secretory system conjugative DNA transfer family protein [Microcoleus sp. herbarium2]|uniref:type IV secretory system conjugative DNA transfer family protein n=1 Tax=Microcoleus sp. herbarium2 TaxID=3055433 RepID=UPI002FD416E6
MLSNINQPIVAGLLSASIAGIVAATALPFNDRIEYKIGNRIDSQPAWLVPPKAEFRSLERGYGGIKILLALLSTGGMFLTMLIARSEGEQEPVRQRIKQYKNRAYEFGYAAESAYQMSTTATRYKKLAEADEVAFEGEIEQAYMESLGIDPSAQQPLLTGTATLESISNPGDKVDPQANSPELPDQIVRPKMPVLTNYPSVLIYGAPGSGKTTFAEQEVKRRVLAGHRVIICDPHAAYGAWAGCEVVGGGMDYAAIDAKLEWFATEVRRRYKRIESEPSPTFQPLTLCCDEFTNWAGRCSAASEFFQSALSDIRKAKMFGLIVSHTRTMAGLANAAGMAKLRDEALLEVELLGQQCPKTGNAVPRYEAVVKLPGMPLNKRFILQVPKLSEPHNHQPTKQDSSYLDPIARLGRNTSVDDVSETQNNTSDSSSGKDCTLPEQDSGKLANPYGKGAAGSQDVETTDESSALNESLNGFLAEVIAENLPPVFADDFPLKKHERRVQLAKLVIAKNLGKQKTIYLLWGVTDGGRNHQRYVDAREMLERLMGSDNNAN